MAYETPKMQDLPTVYCRKKRTEIKKSRRNKKITKTFQLIKDLKNG